MEQGKQHPYSCETHSSEERQIIKKQSINKILSQNSNCYFKYIYIYIYPDSVPGQGSEEWCYLRLGGQRQPP